jgi:hypothetical protein
MRITWAKGRGLGGEEVTEQKLAIVVCVAAWCLALTVV